MREDYTDNYLKNKKDLKIEKKQDLNYPNI
jgi:hypothetical protein